MLFSKNSNICNDWCYVSCLHTSNKLLIRVMSNNHSEHFVKWILNIHFCYLHQCFFVELKKEVEYFKCEFLYQKATNNLHDLHDLLYHHFILSLIFLSHFCLNVYIFHSFCYCIHEIKLNLCFKHHHDFFNLFNKHHFLKKSFFQFVTFNHQFIITIICMNFMNLFELLVQLELKNNQI